MNQNPVLQVLAYKKQKKLQNYFIYINHLIIMSTVKEHDFQEIFDFSKSLEQYYYSCRLEKSNTNKNNLSWKCAKFYNLTDAETFRTENESITVLTKIIPSKCANIFDNIENKMVFEKVNYPVEIIKQDK
jgi:hypothetical protein